MSKVEPRYSARIERGPTTNRVHKIRKLSQKAVRELLGKPPRGRRKTPRNDIVSVCISMPLESLEEIDRRADLAGMTRSGFLVRCAITSGLPRP